jgi:hypothetical protein
MAMHELLAGFEFTLTGVRFVDELTWCLAIETIDSRTLFVLELLLSEYIVDSRSVERWLDSRWENGL